ncbi:MAG: GNAT family N-acetyltransferase, partial [Boseongicola sp.]|nr:GNAT family N-acetyltransferase [Boseongicola sp.]
MSAIIVRSSRESDLEALGALFHRSVREGASRMYSPEQCAAWSPMVPAGDAWRQRLAPLDTVVAERNGCIIGFMSFEPKDGYVDFAFVAPEEMGKGVAAALYAVVEGRARSVRLEPITTAASGDEEDVVRAIIL